ncbi:MAG: hypothetical protein JWN73_4918 [Betaproteobacteria bacterium]|nr:hypothetical protein [Betaproteobacteria bacterium]
MSRLLACLLPPLFAVLAGCDQIAVLDGSKAREAEGVAIGSACRQAGRAIEDCFTMNADAPKASVFAGWKEMNDYMVANKLESVKPEVPRAEAKEAKGEGKGKEEPKEASHAAAGEKTAGAAEVASSAPGVPVVPASVEIPGLNAGTAVAPPATIANAPLPKTAPAPAPALAAAPAAPAAAAPNSIALGGQNIPLAVPGTPPAAAAPAAPAAAGAAPAHH